jgi:hypothetical protein
MSTAQTLVLFFGAIVALCVVICVAQDIGDWFDRDDSDYPRGYKRDR